MTKLLIQKPLRVIQLIVISILFFSQSLISQEQTAITTAYVPVPYYPINLDSLTAQYRKEYNSSIKEYEGNYKDKTKEIYEGRFSRIKEQLANGDFYFNPIIDTYFQNILQEIIRGNPELNKHTLRLFVSRDEYPNAYCRGDGTLIFNLTLLRFLDNEDQIAFIIAHEIAHQTFDHVCTAINKRTEYIYSKETKKKLKEINKNPYNRYTNTVELYKEYIFDDRRHSRLHESDADDMGLTYIKNTKYNPLASVETLKILDTVDEQPEEASFNIKNVFDNPAFPFQDKWLKEKETIGFFMGSDDTEEKILVKDSLKTHPDCQKRIALVSEKLPPFDTAAARKIVFTDEFAKMYTYSEFEQVANFYYYNQTGKSLYTALCLLKKYPDDAWLYTQISRTLLELTEAQENHQLSQILEFPASYHAKPYKDFLTFIRKLRLREMALLNHHFTQKYQEKFPDYAPLEELAEEVRTVAVRLK